MQIAENGNAWQTTLDKSGRLHLPAELRKKHGLENGTSIVLVDDAQGAVRLLTLDEFTRRVQEYFRSLDSTEACWSEELIQERHEEAAHDARHP